MQQNWKGEEHVGEEVYFTHSQCFRVCLFVPVVVGVFQEAGRRRNDGRVISSKIVTGACLKAADNSSIVKFLASAKRPAEWADDSPGYGSDCRNRGFGRRRAQGAGS